MISAHVVELAIEYLDRCVAEGNKATLVGMHWYIDGRDKTLPDIDEVNEALSKRPGMFVTRENALVTFSTKGDERLVTSEDMSCAIAEYDKEFSAALAKLRK